jgi:hypothetical protein
MCSRKWLKSTPRKTRRCRLSEARQAKQPPVRQKDETSANQHRLVSVAHKQPLFEKSGAKTSGMLEPGR